jgi:hypothetical protein
MGSGFSRKRVYQCSHGRASANVGGQNLPASDVIYHVACQPSRYFFNGSAHNKHQRGSGRTITRPSNGQTRPGTGLKSPIWWVQSTWMFATVHRRWGQARGQGQAIGHPTFFWTLSRVQITTSTRYPTAFRILVRCWPSYQSNPEPALSLLVTLGYPTLTYLHRRQRCINAVSTGSCVGERTTSWGHHAVISAFGLNFWRWRRLSL